MVSKNNLCMFYCKIILYNLILKVHLLIISKIYIGLVAAKEACKRFGNDWNATHPTQGSVICSKISYLQNCHSCDTWRLLVWKDGACDLLNHRNCRSNATKAGHFYCGYSPCKTGDLVYGGPW